MISSVQNFSKSPWVGPFSISYTCMCDVLSRCTSGHIFLISKRNTMYVYNDAQYDRSTLPSLLCRNMFGDGQCLQDFNGWKMKRSLVIPGHLLILLLKKLFQIILESHQTSWRNRRKWMIIIHGRNLGRKVDRCSTGEKEGTKNKW